MTFCWIPLGSSGVAPSQGGVQKHLWAGTDEAIGTKVLAAIALSHAVMSQSQVPGLKTTIKKVIQEEAAQWCLPEPALALNRGMSSSHRN